MLCVSTRSSKPLLLLIRTGHWIDYWIRDALDNGRDAEVTELFIAAQDIRRVSCDLIQSDLYGGPLHPETRNFARGLIQLMGIDSWLTNRLLEARARGTSESTNIWAARRTIRKLLSDVVESWRQSRAERKD